MIQKENVMRAKENCSSCHNIYIYIYMCVWVISLLLTAVLMCVTGSLVRIGFEDVGDDQFLAAYLAGYWTGTPESKLPFINPIFSKLLSTLYTVFPNAYWYPYSFLGIIFCSCVILMCCVFLVSYEKKIPLWAAGIVNTGIYAAICYDVVFLSFTSVPSIACAAVAAMILCEDYERKNWYIYTVLWAFLLFFAFIIRGQSTLVGICFCAAAVFYRVLDGFRTRQPLGYFMKMGAGIALSAGLILIAFCVSQNFENAQENKAYYEFRRACAEYYDRPRNITQEEYLALGVSDEFRPLLERWFFLDSSVDTKLLNDLSGVNKDEAGSLFVFHQSFKDALKTGYKLIQSDGAVPLLIACMAVFFAAVIQFAAKGKTVWIELTTIALTCIGSFVLCFYTCLVGRFPLREFRVISIPCIIVCILIFLKTLSFDRKAKWLSICRNLAVVVSVVALLANFWHVFHSDELYDKKLNCQNWSHAMDDIATSNPDNIYFYGTKLVSVSEAFPQYDTEIPKNLFYWGGSYLGTEPHRRQMKVNGIEKFDSSLFLQDNVYLITIRDDDEDEILYEYLEWKYGPICCELIEDCVDGKIQVYQFSKRHD